MKTEPRFVKPGDYENYTGNNLNRLLNIDSDSENAANRFLLRIEDTLLARIDEMSFRVHGWNDLTPFQKESLQKAIIEQTNYIIRNSDIFTDSGYDLEKGEIISNDKLYNIEICRIAKTYLRNCGLLNQTIQNHRRINKFF